MKKLLLSPDYLMEFQCIGAACEDHCCKSWNIDIDKNNYFKIKSSSKEVIKSIAKLAYQRNTKSKSDHKYGRMKLDSNGECHFLDEQKFCKIHKEFGASALCNTCAIYPRNYSAIGDYIEQSLLLSCPEAVRTMLLQEKGMDFIESEASKDDRIVAPLGKLNVKMDVFWSLRIFSIEVLQNRQLPINLRLVLLATFINSVSENNQSIEQIEAMIAKYKVYFSSHEYVNAVNQLSFNPLLQFSLSKELLRTIVEEIGYNPRYVEVTNDFILGIKTGPLEFGNNTKEQIELYEKAYTVYKDFEETYDYVIENYLVHLIFSNKFPCNKPTLLKSYLDIALDYFVVKSLLIGTAARKGEITLEDVVKVVQSYSKAIVHNKKGFAYILDKMENCEMDSIAYIISLIKH